MGRLQVAAMFKVNSKKTLNKLVKNSLKEYKMRNTFTLITIILSVSLIAGFAFFSSAIQETNRKELAKRQHVIYHDVTEEQTDTIRDADEISNSAVFKKGNSFEVENNILLPYYLEQNESPMAEINLSEGSYPSNSNQVLVDEALLQKMGVEPEVGKTINIVFLDGTTEAFIVSGLYRTEQETNVFPLYLSKDYAESGSQLKNIAFDISVQIKDASKMDREIFLEVINRIGTDAEVERKNVNPNDAFVNSLFYSNNEITMIVLVSFAVLLVSVLVIYSIFYISISERTRQFGQLRTIGMTKKQVKRMVRKEGTVLSFIGGIIGVLIGATVVFTMKPQGFVLLPFIIYSVAILFANYIMVQISIAKPANIAADISPIEASRVSDYDSKTKKTRNLHRKLSAISLSFIAVQGNRKKSFMTMISLGLAGIVFMCASTFLNSVNEEQFSRQGWLQYGEYIIDLSSNAIQVNEFGETGIKQNNPLSSDLIKKINGISGVKDVISMESLQVSYTYESANEMTDIIAPFKRENEQLIRKYLNAGEFDYDKMINNKEMIITHNKIAKEIFGWEFKIGDTVKLKWFNGEQYVEDAFTIAGILEDSGKVDNNTELFQITYNTGWFLIPQELLTNMMTPGFNLNTRIIVSCDNYEENEAVITKELQALTDINALLTMSTFSEQLEHHKEQFRTIYVSAMGAALFVIAFSMINLLNTLISSVVARKREFACLGAIGASKKQIATMIQGEGFYFALVNISVTVLFGSLLGYSLVKVMEWNGLSYLEYQFPLVYLLSYCVMVLVVPIALSYIIIKIYNRKSLVERLREIE